jgi:signal transduction histidine kinase
MSTILHLPVKSSEIRAAVKNEAAQQKRSRSSQTKRAAHDLRNCMSVLLLAITSLKDNGNQSVISASRAQALENVVHEMERLVDEMVGLAEPQTDK